MAEPSAKTSEEARAVVVPVGSLEAAERRQLFALMSSHFDNVDERRFFRDLDEKLSVLLLRDRGERILGFSTMGLLRTELAGQPLAAVFVGDTVIEPEYWGQSAWLYAWSRRTFEMAKESGASPCYLLLLTSTHRSYRFTSAFFNEFHPRPDQPLPAELAARREVLVRLKFPDEFDPATGVVKLREPTPPRPERRDTPEREHPEIRYFFEANPGGINGDFLTCLAEISYDNLTPLGRRMIRGAE
jgi:GNAT superfamily N-acetyltransferase